MVTKYLYMAFILIIIVTMVGVIFYNSRIRRLFPKDIDEFDNIFKNLSPEWKEKVYKDGITHSEMTDIFKNELKQIDNELKKRGVRHSAKKNNLSIPCPRRWYLEFTFNGGRGHKTLDLPEGENNLFDVEVQNKLKELLKQTEGFNDIHLDFFEEMEVPKEKDRNYEMHYPRKKWWELFFKRKLEITGTNGSIGYKKYHVKSKDGDIDKIVEAYHEHHAKYGFLNKQLRENLVVKKID
jgi:hypothetical protein